MHRFRLALCSLAIALIVTPTIRLRAQDSSDELIVLDRQLRELAKVGKVDAARPLTRRLLEAVKRRYGAESKEYADALLSVPVAGGGRPSEADMLLALKIFEKRLEPDDPAIPNVLLLLAQEYIRGSMMAPMGRLLDPIRDPRFADAKPLINRALAILEKRPGSDSVEYADGLMVLGQYSKGVGKLDEAEPQFQRAFSIFEKSLGSTGRKPRIALYRDLGRRDDHLRVLRQDAQLTEAALGPDHAGTLRAIEHLAETLRKYCHDDEAAALEKSKLQRILTKRLEGVERNIKEMHPGYPHVWNDLGDKYAKLGRLADARRTYQRAIAAQGSGKDLEHAIAMAGIAEIDRLEGRLGTAEDGFRRAIAVFDRQKVPPRVAWLDRLAMTYRAQGREAEADDMRPRTESVRAEERRRRGCQD